MQFAKHFFLSLQARLAGAAFGVVASLSLFATVVSMFASTSGGVEPTLAQLQLWPLSAESTQVAKLKPALPASEAAGKPSGSAGSG